MKKNLRKSPLYEKMITSGKKSFETQYEFLKNELDTNPSAKEILINFGIATDDGLLPIDKISIQKSLDAVILLEEKKILDNFDEIDKIRYGEEKKFVLKSLEDLKDEKN